MAQNEQQIKKELEAQRSQWIDELKAVDFIECSIDPQEIYNRIYKDNNAKSFDDVFKNLTQKDRHAPLGSKEAESLVTALEIASESYTDVNFPKLHEDIIGLAKPTPKGKGFSMSDVKAMLSQSEAIQTSRHKISGKPAQESLYDDMLKNITSVTALRKDVDNATLPEIVAISLMADKDMHTSRQLIEIQKNNFYQDFKKFSSRVLSDPSLADIADKLPQPAKYLREFATPDGRAGLMDKYESILPAKAKATEGSFGVKNVNTDTVFEDAAKRFTDSNDTSRVTKFIVENMVNNAEALKRAASPNREADAKSYHKRPYVLFDDGQDKLISKIREGFDIGKEFTRTTAHIQMFSLAKQDSHLGGNTYINNATAPFFHGSSDKSLTDKLTPDGSIILRTGIDGKSNPTYSDNPTGSDNAFAVMSINKSLGQANKMAICVSKNPLDALAFTTGVEGGSDNRYDAVLYTTPDSVQNVIDDLYELNQSRAIDLIGDLRPEQEQSNDKDDMEFTEQPASGREFAKNIELEAAKSDRNIVVLLPTVGAHAFESWTDLRQAVESTANERGLDQDAAKSAFLAAVNNSAAESVNRRQKLQEIIQQPAPDNTKQLIEESKTALTQEQQEEYRPTIRNPTISGKRW